MIILDPIAASGSGVFVSSNVPETDYPAHSTTTLYVVGDRVIDTTAHLVYESIAGSRSAVTMTIASPCVVTWIGHGQAANTPISFTTTGALGTGLVAGTTYYVRAPAADNFTLSATPGGAAINTTGSQSGVHTATASLNVNHVPPNTVYWNPIGATNRWNMFDQYNNTQTTNADSIVVVLSPKLISQGLYGGNVDADSWAVTVTDAVEGVVYTETDSLIVSDSDSSFFNWCFKRILRKTYFITTLLPVYANATVTITISKIGGVPKCGMLSLGPLVDAGLTQYGLASEFKDYSSTTFNFDGTSSSIVRGYAKRMSLDLEINNELIDSVQEQLANFRQRNVVWIGTSLRGSAIVFGKFSGFKNVMSYFETSRMTLQIEGTV